ncbi:unnamed protein product [Protopolystoma xenopodis]|uniref:Uncharacterized protein n=1 Tax=Protopolystoma xenopodis TaxID=117903 RepID=A0A448XHD0_9PLAT|nr:unnamed protein product [Protopolystoma xenopodis]
MTLHRDRLPSVGLSRSQSLKMTSSTRPGQCERRFRSWHRPPLPSPSGNKLSKKLRAPESHTHTHTLTIVDPPLPEGGLVVGRQLIMVYSMLPTQDDRSKEKEEMEWKR